MIMDVNMWCQNSHTMLFLSCGNMDDFDHSGISMLDDCPADATGLVRESCHWVCKGGRPVARCVWEFARSTSLILPGQLQTCWLSEACNGQTVDVTAACKPNLVFNATDVILGLQKDLAAAINAHRTAEDRVQQVEKLHNATKALMSGNLSHNLTNKAAVAKWEEELASSRQEMSMAVGRLSGVSSELQDAQTQLEARGALHAALNQSHAREREELKNMLSQASMELNRSHWLSYLHHFVSETQYQTDKKARRSLLTSIAEYEQRWRAEQAAHNQTKMQLQSESESADEARSWLVVTLVVLGFILVICTGCITFLVIRQRKWRSLAINAASNVGAEVVLGRPVGSAGSSAYPAGNVFEAFPVKPQEPGMAHANSTNSQTPLRSQSPKVAWS